MNRTARAFWIGSPGHGEIRDVTLPDPAEGPAVLALRRGTRVPWRPGAFDGDAHGLDPFCGAGGTEGRCRLTRSPPAPPWEAAFWHRGRCARRPGGAGAEPDYTVQGAADGAGGAENSVLMGRQAPARL